MQNTAGNRKQEWVRRAFWPLLGIGVLGLVVAAYLFIGGQVQGVEFSPQHFSHRSYHYYALGGLRIGPRQAREWQSALESHLHEQGWVEFAGPATWVTVHRKRGSGPWQPGPAKPMCEELRCFSGASGEWVAWSKQHPELAEQLWPRVVVLAREGRYGQIQNALLAARLAEKDGNFEKYFNEFVDSPTPDSDIE